MFLTVIYINSMMKKRSFIFIYVLIALFSVTGYSQDQQNIDFSKNAIHGTVGTFLITNSFHLSYDRLIKAKDKGFFKAYYGTVKVGVNKAHSLFVPGAGVTRSLIGSVGITALTGKGKKHLELSLGISAIRSFNEVYSGEGDKQRIVEKYSISYPQISIGYRRQISKGFLFRTGVGVPEWAYIGFGYSF